MSAKSHGLERMIFFSDAVIAIMITLLALELPVPDVEEPSQLWGAFAEHGSVYIAFLISFSVIAATWTAHHMLFTHVSRANPGLITLNLIVLFGYVLIPWASKTLGEVPNAAGVMVYSAAMTLLGGATLVMIRHIKRSGLLDAGAPRAVITGLLAWSGFTTAMFAVSIPIAYLAGRWTMVAWPVGYLGMRLVAEYYARRGRKAA
ncbi:MAG TPA: TMEM175 family protein [Stackebrandtia sp.]|jgi:uncharacterized membrane protein|uniref:TMEM175 family protein n=1 Tax=Stackebrandtia sp. TaxID=2023065 RepID=UPI002D459D75|nr:TMEM175 family protein [Stackebrandtia sp.]HZE40085.1 TMEM175 family protein [Stackebrandtia sp.]